MIFRSEESNFPSGMEFQKSLQGAPGLEWLQDSSSHHWPGSLFSFSERCEFDLLIGHQGCHIQLLLTKIQRTWMECSPQILFEECQMALQVLAGTTLSHTVPEICSYFCCIVILLLTMKSNIKTKLTIPTGGQRTQQSACCVTLEKSKVWCFGFLICEIIILIPISEGYDGS